MKIRYKLILYISLFLGLLSCKEDKAAQNDVELASAYGSTLFLSEVIHLIPEKTNDLDRSKLIREYVDEWIRQQAIIHAINEDDSVSLYTIEKKVERIKNQLIALEYKKILLERELDAIVSDSELVAYYDNNLPLFKLERNLVKGSFIQIPKDWSIYNKVNKLLDADGNQTSQELDSICAKHSPSYFFTDSNWVSFNKMVKNTPFEDADSKRFMNSSKISTKSDQGFFYILKIRDYKLKGELAPFSYYRDEIMAKIIAERKRKLLINVENQLFSQAKSSNEVEIYIE